MVKNMVALLAFVMLSTAHAQTSQQQTPNQGGDSVVQNVPGAAGAGAAAAGQAPAPTGSPIYILNNQNQRFNGQVENSSNSGAKQATTQAQAHDETQTTNTNAAAESIRKGRIETESATEDGIVQALERDRMNEEIRRRDRFNNALDGVQPTATPTTVIVQPLPVAPAAPAPTPVQVAPVPVPPAPQPTPIVVHDPTPAPQPVIQVITVPTPIAPAPEVQEPVRPRRAKPAEVISDADDVEVKREEPKRDEHPYYVSGLLGIGKYPGVINIDGTATGGVAVGMIRDRFAYEASFLYGKYQAANLYQAFDANGIAGYQIVDMTQYDLSVAAKYNILTGRLRPYVGVLGSYVRRSYSNDYGGQSSDSFRTSNAIDVGALVGADFQLTDSFAIGVEFRYSTNVWYNQNTNYPSYFVYAQSPQDIEALDYYQTMLVGKFSF